MKYKDVMKLFSYLIPLVMALFVLVACTGSSEESDSNFLFVVAFQDKVGLVDAESMTSDDFSVQQDSLFAPKDLPNDSKAVAFDFSSRNREVARDELFLLSRDADNKAYVSVFDMTKANIANGDGALVTKRDAFEVSVGLARAENVAEPSSFCVTDIQSSETGRYIVLLSNQRVCDNNTQETNAIDIIDLGSSLQDEPKLVYHKNLAQNIGEASQMFFDQVAESVFFFEGADSQGELRKLSVPEFNEETVLRNVNITDVIDIQAFVQVSGSDEELIIVRPENYAVVTNYLDTATLEADKSFEETVKQVFPNANRFTPKDRFFALTTTEFLVYDTPDLATNISTSINAKDAFYEPRDNYVYLLTDRNIRRYNVLGVFDVPSVKLDNFNVTGLEDVQLFSWVREASVAPAIP